MLKAFNYMFKDNKFKQKAFVYFCFVLLANLFTQIGNVYAPIDRNTIAPIQYYILGLLGAITLFIPTGYGISCTKALMEQNDNYILPLLNVKNCFVLGFKLMVSVIFMSIVFGLLYALLMIPIGILGAFLPSYAYMEIVASILSLLFILVIAIYSPAFCAIFAKKEWITTFFRFIRATKLIGKGIGQYFKGTALFIVAMIILGIINTIIITLLVYTIIGAIIAALIISLISSYTVFVFVYIVAKSIKPECIE